MSKVLRTLGCLAVLYGISSVREADAESHPPLFPDFCELDVDFNWFEPVYCDCPDGLQPNEGSLPGGGFHRLHEVLLHAERQIGNVPND